MLLVFVTFLCGQLIKFIKVCQVLLLHPTEKAQDRERTYFVFLHEELRREKVAMFSLLFCCDSVAHCCYHLQREEALGVITNSDNQSNHAKMCRPCASNA